MLWETVLLRFVHTKEDGNKIRFTMIGQGGNGFALEFTTKELTIDAQIEAIEHINRYNTGHSEAIVTKDYNNSRKFTQQIDAAAVYVNASTRFTDGFEFGFGAEIGISTQKIHARGPMGLDALTTGKYVILGDGQVRK